MPTRPDFYAFFLTLISIGIVGALLIMNKSVPPELWSFAGLSGGYAAGINVTTP